MNLFRILSILCLVFMLNGCCLTPPNCGPEGRNITYGPDVYYRYSGYWGEDTKDSDVKHIGNVGFGGFAHWLFCEDIPDLGLRSGIYYSPFGAKYEYESDGYGTYTNKDKLGYLSIPFSFTYRVFDEVRIEGGPNFDFLLSAKQKNTYNGQTETYDFKDDVNKFQFGFNVGFSYTHQQTGLGGYFRYDGGLTKIPSTDSDIKLYNGAISLGARYRLNDLFNK